MQPNQSYDSINGERTVQRKTIRDRHSYRLISRLQMGLPTKNFERLFVMNDSIQEFNESRMGSNVYGVVWECSRIGIGVCLRSRNLWVRVPPLLLSQNRFMEVGLESRVSHPQASNVVNIGFQDKLCFSCKEIYVGVIACRYLLIQIH